MRGGGRQAWRSARVTRRVGQAGKIFYESHFGELAHAHSGAYKTLSHDTQD